MLVPSVARTLRRPIVWIGVGIMSIALPLLGLRALLPVLNDDFHARITDTQKAPGVGRPVADPTEGLRVRLVLHRLIGEENAVEASVQLFASGLAGKAVIGGSTKFAVEVSDGSSMEPFGLRHESTLSAASHTPRKYVWTESVASESERFTLPSYPSVGGFPFDTVNVRPVISVFRDGEPTSDFHSEIQKRFPGRLMTLSGTAIAEVELARSVSEQFMVLGSSAMFLLFSVLLIIVLYRRPHGIRSLEEFLAVGGYVLAVVGFRDLIGLSRTSGISALEMIVVGCPMAGLCVTILHSMWRTKPTSPAPPASEGGTT